MRESWTRGSPGVRPISYGPDWWAALKAELWIDPVSGQEILAILVCPPSQDRSIDVIIPSLQPTMCNPSTPGVYINQMV